LAAKGLTLSVLSKLVRIKKLIESKR